MGCSLGVSARRYRRSRDPSPALQADLPFGFGTRPARHLRCAPSRTSDPFDAAPAAFRWGTVTGAVKERTPS